MKHNSLSLLLLALLTVTASLTVRPQQPSFTAASIKPFDKAVPGQVMEVLIEGLTSGPAPIVLPETDFNVEVLQDGVSHKARIRITKFTMMADTTPDASNKNTLHLSGKKLRNYQSVSFVVPKGLRPGPAEVVASYKGERANAVGMEIIEKPLKPVLGTTSVIAAGGVPLEVPMKLEGNDLGWRLERGANTRLSVNPLVDPDDPNSAVLIRFKQDGNDYDAVTRIISNPSRVLNRGSGVGFVAAREDLQVEVPAALMLGKAQVEIRLKANDQLSDPVILTATITDRTRAAEVPNVNAPRVLLVTPKRVGAGQLLTISVDQLRTLEPSPKDVRVIVEQNKARYLAKIEQNSALIGPSKDPDAPVGILVRTRRHFIGRVQILVINPSLGEETGTSAPVDVEIVDQVLPPEVISVGESTDADLERLKQMYEIQRQAGKEFPAYDPARRYLTIRARGVDQNPKFVRITLEHTDRKHTLSHNDFSFYSADAVIVKLPEDLNSGKVKLTIENSDGDRYSTPVTQSFVLQPRR